MWSDWQERIKNRPKVRRSLLWEYDLADFDWQYMRSLVVERVVELGWDEDFYAIFALYGGKKGVRQIIRDEVLILSNMDIAFVCAAFNLKKEELKCYIRKQSRGTYEFLKSIMADTTFSGFSLAGGTALSLLIGHRKSIYLDLSAYWP